MKVYMYYLADKSIIESMKQRSLIDSPYVQLSDILDTYLYGYTTKKKLAKEFEKIRNMNVFKKLIKEMSEDEYSEFDDRASSFARISMVDVEYPFHQETLQFQDQLHLKIALTSSESWYCVDNYKEAINDFLASIPKIPSINIFRNDIKTLLIDMDYADSVLESHKEYIKTDSVMSELASYSCYYAWENIIGIMICLYQGIFSNSGLFEVIKNAADS